MRFGILMVSIFSFAMGVSCLCSCDGGFNPKQQHSTPALDSLLADSISPGEESMPQPVNEDQGAMQGHDKAAKIKVKNDLDYSAGFLKKLTYAGLGENIELYDSLIILETKDSFVFPMDLPMGKWVNFIAMKSGYLYSLDVSKINYTTLDFNFELRKGKQTIDQLKGKADINPGFVLASEPDEDESTGSTYGANEYLFESPDCSFSIRLGDDEGVKKLRVVKQCKAGKYNIALEDCPLLLEK